jgi:virginiamycin B lyase
MRWLRVPAVLLAVAGTTVTGIAFAGATFAGTGQKLCSVDCVTTFVQRGAGRPFAITQGPRHSEWFGQSRSIGRIGPGGKVSRYRVAGTQGTDISWITVAPDKSIWFVERVTSGIGRMNKNGTVRQYAIPDGSGPQGIVMGPDGFVYFTEPGLSSIGRLNPRSGAVRSFKTPGGGDPLDLAFAPDGKSLWYTEENANRVGHMTLDGSFTEYDLAAGATPLRIVAGPDGAMWFTELHAGVVRITQGGEMTTYPVGDFPIGITVGRDGMLYVALYAGQLVQVNLQGQVTAEWSLPAQAFQAGRGKGTDIWVTDYYGRHVYRVTPYAQG